MRHPALALLGLGLVACGDSVPTATLEVYELAPAMSIARNGKNAGVPLSGRQEVPARETRARGTAVLNLRSGGEALHYRLIVANIHNVVQAHIHIGAAGANGPVVAFLFGPVAAGGGRVNGVIAVGVITADDLVGPLAGLSMDDLMTHIRSGNAYVNVHTSDGVAPSNTGPGDFPGGEVRGQIR